MVPGGIHPFAIEAIRNLELIDLGPEDVASNPDAPDPLMPPGAEFKRTNSGAEDESKVWKFFAAIQHDPVGTIHHLVRIPRTTENWLLVVLTAAIAAETRAVQTFTMSYVTVTMEGSVSLGNLTFFALLVGGSFSSLVVGTLADWIDRSTLGVVAAIGGVVLVGATAFAGEFLDALSWTGKITLMAAWFFVVGFLLYATVPLSSALISHSAEAAFSGRLFGVIQTFSALGSAVGPAAFGYAATQVGIVAAFPLIALTGVLVAALFFLTKVL